VQFSMPLPPPGTIPMPPSLGGSKPTAPASAPLASPVQVPPDALAAALGAHAAQPAAGPPPAAPERAASPSPAATRAAPRREPEPLASDAEPVMRVRRRSPGVLIAGLLGVVAVAAIVYLFVHKASAPPAAPKPAGSSPTAAEQPPRFAPPLRVALPTTAPETAPSTPAPAAATVPVPEQAVPTPRPKVAPAVAAEPQRTPAARPDDADYQRLLASADRKYNTGNFLAAIGEYRKAAALKPTGQALVGLARALYDANRSAEALRELDRAIAADGRYAPAWLLLGEIHQADGRVPEARAAYERFLRLQPAGDQARAVREILAQQLR
jgi:hypothetical protein